MKFDFNSISQMGYGLVFDLDGTLIDSEEQIIKSVNTIRAEHNFDFASDSWISSRIGLPAQHLFEDLELSNSDVVELVTKFRSFLAQEVEKGSKIYPGVIDFLSSAKDLHIPMAVASNKPDDLLIKVLAHSHLQEYFIHMQGTSNLPPKPSSKIIEECISQIGVNKVLMIGDRTEDMLAVSQLQNCVGIGIASGSHSFEKLYGAGAEVVYSNFYSLYLDFKTEGGVRA